MELVDLAAPPVTEIVAIESATTAFVDNVIIAESGGNPHARPCDPTTGKPRSSAFGAGQFIEATWLEMVRTYRRDLAARSDQELLQLRADFNFSREMTIRYAEKNAAYLRENGLKTTPAALYLAHFAGPTGAARLLGAEPDSPVEEILSEGAVKANPFLAGQTAAGVYAWAAKKMNAKAPAMPVVKVTRPATAYHAIPGCKAADPTTRAAAAPAKTPKAARSLVVQTVRLVINGVARIVRVTRG